MRFVLELAGGSPPCVREHAISDTSAFHKPDLFNATQGEGNSETRGT